MDNAAPQEQPEASLSQPPGSILQTDVLLQAMKSFAHMGDAAREFAVDIDRVTRVVGDSVKTCVTNCFVGRKE